MSPTLRLVVAATITTSLAAAASTAVAQEGPPGTCACAAPTAVVVVAAAAPAPLPTWGIGLHLTSLSLAPEASPDAKTEYGGGGLQLRYRLAPRWQLELSVDHVTAPVDDAHLRERHLQSATLAALYHFRPRARWDWYLLAGIGATGDGNPELSDEQRDATTTAHVHLGAGVERRFHHIGIGAELRAVGVAPPEDDEVAPGTAMSVAQPEAEGSSGGQLSIAATYYF